MYEGKIISEVYDDGELVYLTSGVAIWRERPIFVKDADRIIKYVDDNTRYHHVVYLKKESLLKHFKYPNWFSWGYVGSRSAQTALAILFDYLKDELRALAMYQAFHHKVIARLPMNENFTLTTQTIENFITEFEGERMREA